VPLRERRDQLLAGLVRGGVDHRLPGTRLLRQLMDVQGPSDLLAGSVGRTTPCRADGARFGVVLASTTRDVGPSCACGTRSRCQTHRCEDRCILHHGRYRMVFISLGVYAQYLGACMSPRFAALLLLPGLALAQGAPEAPTEPPPAMPVTPAPVAGPIDYDLTSSQGRLYVLVRYKRGTLGASLAHDHVVVASGWSGSVTWDAANLGACNVVIDVPVGGLSVDPGTAREWESLEDETSAGDKETIRDNFRGSRQLDMNTYSTIRYQSTSCAGGSDGVVNVTGSLTVRGVSKTVTVPMTIREGEGSFGATGRFDATHSDFGMDPYSAAFGALKNDQRLSFIIDVRGTAQ
jgi:polyisoprenoid-binding protein YceI